MRGNNNACGVFEGTKLRKISWTVHVSLRWIWGEYSVWHTLRGAQGMQSTRIISLARRARYAGHEDHKPCAARKVCNPRGS